MTARGIKAWSAVHKWTSLICTVFLLLLCLTGLPLIFYHEIEHALGNDVETPVMAPDTPLAPVEKSVEAARKEIPSHVPMFVSWDEEHPNQVFVSMAEAPNAPPEDNRILVHDGRTGEVLAEPAFRDTVMFFLYRLHVDMFAGLPGKLFLGLMGLLFVVAIVSGIVLYAPFMRRLDFGTVRRDKSTRVKWLDLHNLLGVVTIAWALVVGGTGVINTWADLILKYWQYDQLTAMVGPYMKAPIPANPVPLDTALETAKKVAPEMTPSFVAYPGTAFSSPKHYAVFMHGDTPLTARLLRPVLVDAETGEMTATRDLPWYVTGLLVSQPLHFGDYGGMPLKIVWAILDIITIIVLGSGLYLWLARRKTPAEARLAELERAAGDTSPQAAE